MLCFSTHEMAHQDEERRGEIYRLLFLPLWVEKFFVFFCIPIPRMCVPFCMFFLLVQFNNVPISQGKLNLFFPFISSLAFCLMYFCSVAKLFLLARLFISFSQTIFYSFFVIFNFYIYFSLFLSIFMFFQIELCFHSTFRAKYTFLDINLCCRCCMKHLFQSPLLFSPLVDSFIYFCWCCFLFFTPYRCFIF